MATGLDGCHTNSRPAQPEAAIDDNVKSAASATDRTVDVAAMIAEARADAGVNEGA